MSTNNFKHYNERAEKLPLWERNTFDRWLIAELAKSVPPEMFEQALEAAGQRSQKRYQVMAVGPKLVSKEAVGGK